MVLKRDFLRRLNLLIIVSFIVFIVAVAIYFYMTFQFGINSIQTALNVIQASTETAQPLTTIRGNLTELSFLFYIQLIMFILSVSALLVAFWYTTQRYLIEKRNALIDPLTQIYNRKAVFFALRRELRKSERFGHPTSVALIDIDFFKKYNDTLGHVAGDNVLKKFATLIKETVREYDVFGRYGGEEFIIVFPETKVKDARKICERLRERVYKEHFYGEEKLAHKKVTISIGVAEISGRRKIKKETLVNRADMNLYRAKHAGRNQVISDEESQS